MRFLLLLFLLPLLVTGFSQMNPDSLMHIEVLGNSTDPWINGDLGKKHQVFYNPTSTSNEILLLHLVGTIDNPNSTTYFPTLATEHGYHVINLMYRNWNSAHNACASSTDPNCYLNFRKEIIEGVDYSSEANVNAANSIQNRLIKLLEYLQSNYPGQGWDQFFDGSLIHWDKIMVSGHSQGGGHAAVIAMTEPVQRVLMFASPNDYSDTLNALASWPSSSHLVPDSNYYGFNAYYDDAVDFYKQMEAWNALGLSNYGDTVNVDEVGFPFEESRQLYTLQQVPSGGIEDLTHNIMIRDNQTPLDLSGAPIFLDVWKYMLGINDNSLETTISEHPSRFKLYPNPSDGFIHVEHDSGTSGLKLRIYNLTGSYLQTVNLEEKVDVSFLDSGVYLVELFTKEASIGYEKIILR
ncbi:T9SS type A sorting domain-containing protein [Parvicella tangerina]|uniref:Secretion system C-terminal sorting domain-containing protein n=1 Tax=Parvicella tangerina TaxID=2829795 RepID=A0A916JL07_9FLAO|nr:T9SS type A sorting domain-containing protein [Parvicella tangerina]CAG5080183.1 hypothetical protein CRYO30217_01211 [Parvicella tangerina]